MDDTMRTLLSALLLSEKHNKLRQLQTYPISVAADAPRSVARPHISLKARMLGGQAETIMRLGGLSR